MKWRCGWRTKWVRGTDNSHTSSGMFPRVPSFAFISWKVWLFSHTFSKEKIIPIRSLYSGFDVRLAASRPDDAFIDMTANSPLGWQKHQPQSKLHSWFYRQPCQWCHSIQFFHWNIFAMFEQSRCSNWLLKHYHYYLSFEGKLWVNGTVIDYKSLLTAIRSNVN